MSKFIRKENLDKLDSTDKKEVKNTLNFLKNMLGETDKTYRDKNYKNKKYL